MALAGKTVVLGVCGGIAAYKAAEIVRLLVKSGAEVSVVMTRNAAEFVTPLTLQTLSGRPVATDLFDLTQESEIGHIQLADAADVLVIAPATANMIAKAAFGLADDLLSTVTLATRAPVVMAPAMNVNMYANAAVKANAKTLRKRGMRLIDPDVGPLACGYEGAGRLPDPEIIVSEIERVLSRQDFSGKKVVVSAGPTREALDPVRFVSNRSTGRMGYSLARAAWRRGADVTLVSGPTSIDEPYGVRTVRVTTAAEMQAAVRKEVGAASVLIMAAAVADYRPATTAAQKMKKGKGKKSIEVERTADILATLPKRRGRLVVGFAAETEDVIANAERKRKAKKLDLIVANDVSRSDAGFEVETNAVTLIDRDGCEEIGVATKDEIADRVLDRVVALRSPQRAKRP